MWNGWTIEVFRPHPPPPAHTCVPPTPPRTNRVYKTREIAGIRRACQIGREVLDIAGMCVKLCRVLCDVEAVNCV